MVKRYFVVGKAAVGWRPDVEYIVLTDSPHARTILMMTGHMKRHGRNRGEAVSYTYEQVEDCLERGWWKEVTAVELGLESSTADIPTTTLEGGTW